jgi:phage replication-related protein YjqB (UPF0714/DUF867 family)
MLDGLAEPRSYGEILQRNLVLGRDFRISFGDANIEKCLLVVPHGGGIEPGTSEIMRAVAKLGNWAWYEFAGYLRQGNREALHVPSTEFDEPTLLSLRLRAGFCVEFHGTSQTGSPLVYVGGTWDAGRRIMGGAINLFSEKHGINAVDPMSQISSLQEPTPAVRGKRADSVKLEFSRETRNLLFLPDASREARGRRSPRLSPLARSIHMALQQLCSALANRQD